MAQPRQKFKIEDEFELPQKSGSSKGSEEKDTEQSRVAKLAQGRAQARTEAKDPDGAANNKLDGIQAQLDQANGVSNPSLDVQGNVIKLKFNVPIVGQSGIQNEYRKNSSEISPAHRSEQKPTDTEKNVPNQNSPAESKRASNNWDEQKKAEEEGHDQSFSTSPQKKDPNTNRATRATISNDQQSPQEKNTNDDEINSLPISDDQTPSGEQTPDAEETQKEAEQKLAEEEQVIENQKQQENAKEEVQAEAEKKQQEAKNAEVQQKIQSLQQIQAALAPLTAQQNAERQLSRIKQEQDKKLQNLKSKRRNLKMELEVAKGIETTIKVTQKILLWLARIFLPWFALIIPLILAVIFFVAWLFLWMPRSALIVTIAYLKHKLASVEEDIKKVEKTRGKAGNMIKLNSQRQRIGNVAPQPKFNVS